MKAVRISFLMCLFVLVSLSLSACGPGQFLGPTLTPTPTVTLTPTPTSTSTPTPPATPTATATPTPVVFTIDAYSWEVSASLLSGEPTTIAVTFTPLSKEIVEKNIFPLGARASAHQVNPASIYLTDREGNKYYVEKGVPPLGGTLMKMKFDTLTVTVNFPDIPTDAEGFQLHIPGHPVIDLVFTAP